MDPKVLIVDDDEAILKSLKRGLELENFNVSTADGGRNALNIIAANPPDIIVLDINMPDMTGLELLKIWRKKEQTQHIPVIMLTAWEDRDKWKKATNINHGLISAYLKKPITENELLETLHKVYYNNSDEMIDNTREKGYQRIQELN